MRKAETEKMKTDRQGKRGRKRKNVFSCLFVWLSPVEHRKSTLQKFNVIVPYSQRPCKCQQVGFQSCSMLTRM